MDSGHFDSELACRARQVQRSEKSHLIDGDGNFKQTLLYDVRFLLAIALLSQALRCRNDNLLALCRQKKISFIQIRNEKGICRRAVAVKNLLIF